MSTPPKQTQRQKPKNTPKRSSTGRSTATATTSESSASAGSAPLIIQEDESVKDFVKHVFHELNAPSQNEQRSKVCRTLENDSYFTVGTLRSAKRDETQWVAYAKRNKFSDGFTKTAAKLLYPSSYQRSQLSIFRGCY